MTLVKRMQRKVLGGTAYVRIYSDGSMRLRFDHPSNSLAVETAMAGLLVETMQAAGRVHGIELTPGCMAWRDDPAPSSEKDEGAA